MRRTEKTCTVRAGTMGNGLRGNKHPPSSGGVRRDRHFATVFLVVARVYNAHKPKVLPVTACTETESQPLDL